MDSKTVGTLWAFIEAYDRTGNQNYLFTALGMLDSLIDQIELPEGKITEGWILETKKRHGKPFLQGVDVEITKDNLKEILKNWIEYAFGYYHLEPKAKWGGQLIKVSLVKLLVALGCIANPFSERDVLLDFEEEG